MDRALWAIWFDLKPEHVDDYLNWSHDEYLPALRARPGVVWTAQYKNATGPAMLNSVHQRFERPAQGEAALAAAVPS